MLTLPVSVATSECSFSKLKIVKNYLRSTMSQERLNSILSIESTMLNNVDLKETVDKFASIKARKVNLDKKNYIQ